MPIYEYRCSSCGFQKEHLLKVSDPLLTECPDCGKSTYQKQLTAAGFQLKGSGWYATDFKGGTSATTAKSAGGTKDGGADSAASKDAGAGDSSSKDSGAKDSGAKAKYGGGDKPAAAPAASSTASSSSSDS